MKKEKISVIVIIRVFAILSVVLGHAIVAYSGSWTTYTMAESSNFLKYLYKYISIYQMPLFMSVSGYLFYYLKSEKGKYQEYGAFIFAKAKRLLKPFFMIGILWVVPLHLNFDPNFKGISYFEGVVGVLINKIATNLWFLPTLFVIFAVMWFVVKYEKGSVYTWAVTSVFAVVNVLSVKLPSIAYISNITKYLIFFYLGCLIKKYSLNNISRKYELAFFIAQFLIFINSSPVSQLISSSCSVMFFFVFFTEITQKDTQLIQNKFIKSLDSDSFGIYLFHSSLIYPILRCLSSVNVSPLVVGAMTFSIILAISWGLTHLLRKFTFTRNILGV